MGPNVTRSAHKATDLRGTSPYALVLAWLGGITSWTLPSICQFFLIQPSILTFQSVIGNMHYQSVIAQ
eukprot:11741680-Ditylum_brightwellii.AAC.1